jgi:hypothetical protein
MLRYRFAHGTIGSSAASQGEILWTIAHRRSNETAK